MHGFRQALYAEQSHIPPITFIYDTQAEKRPAEPEYYGVSVNRKSTERRAVYVQEYITVPLGEKKPLYPRTGAFIL